MRSFSSTQIFERSISVSASRLVWAKNRTWPAPRTSSCASRTAVSEGAVMMEASRDFGFWILIGGRNVFGAESPGQFEAFGDQIGRDNVDLLQNKEPGKHQADWALAD